MYDKVRNESVGRCAEVCVCKILDCGLLLICTHAVPFFQCQWYLSNWII